MKRRALGAGLVLLLAGCGGVSQGRQPVAGASIAPAGAPLFVWANTDLRSAQWRESARLLARFPDGNLLVRSFERDLRKDRIDFARDLKPVLGSEVDTVLLDFRNGGNDAVGLMRSRNPASFGRLLERGRDPAVHEQVSGWTIFSDRAGKLSRFAERRRSGVLADSRQFATAVEAVPGQAMAKAFLDVTAAAEAIRRAIAGEAVSMMLGRPEHRWLSASAVAEPNGVRVDLSVPVSGAAGAGTAELPSELRAGALVYLSFHSLGAAVGQILAGLGPARLNVGEALRRIESRFGLSLDRDLLPVLDGEGAVAVYPGLVLPTEVVVLKQDDERPAKRLLERIASRVRLAGGNAHEVTVEGVQVEEFRVRQLPITLFAAVFGGKLVLSNSQDGIEAVREDGAKLKDDPLFRAAAAGAGLPEKTRAFLYLNLKDGLPAVFGYARLGRTKIPDIAERNTKPLQSALAYLSERPDRLVGSLFVSIEGLSRN